MNCVNLTDRNLRGRDRSEVRVLRATKEVVEFRVKSNQDLMLRVLCGATGAGKYGMGTSLLHVRP